MPHPPVGKLRRAIARVHRQRNPKRRRYGSEIRRAVASYAVAQRSRGVSARSTAASLGLPYKTLCFWLQGQPNGFRAVAVAQRGKPEPERSELVWITAQGHRVEGLSREDVAFVLRSLG